MKGGTLSTDSPSGSLNTLSVVHHDETGSRLPIVVSAIPATNGLMIVRGVITASSGSFTLNSGEGVTGSATGTLSVTINFTINFQDAPACFFTNEGGAGFLPNISSNSASSVVVAFGGASSIKFHFLAIGQRLTTA